MQEDTIIQQNLFAINNDPKHTNSSNEIPEDLSNAILKDCLLYTSDAADE